jgi:hypothetical protein
MKCPDCKAITGEGDCAECRALAEEMAANSEALSGIRDEELPSLLLSIPRRRVPYSWIAAAAAVLVAVVLPIVRQGRVAPPQHPSTGAQTRVPEPLHIKILTPDPDVVIYWLIDPKQGELR